MYSQQKKLLVVEDDVVMRDIIIESLSSAYSILTASEGQEALQKINIHMPELVLLDMMLPKLNGFEILEKVRASTDQKIASTQVIVFSNLSGEKDIERAQGLGITAYFPKAAVSIDIVIQKINEVMDSIVV